MVCYSIEVLHLWLSLAAGYNYLPLCSELFFRQGSRYYQVKCGRLDLTVSNILAGLGRRSEDSDWFAWRRCRDGEKSLSSKSFVCVFIFICCVNVWIQCMKCASEADFSFLRQCEPALLLRWIMCESVCQSGVQEARLGSSFASHIAVTVWCASTHPFARALPR